MDNPLIEATPVSTEETGAPDHRKIAIVLFNLGGPTGRKAIYPFLYNFFMDANIIPWPWPLRFLLANFIAFIRNRGPAGTAYGEMGGGSPLLENTLAQARALQDTLTRALSTPIVSPSAAEGSPIGDQSSRIPPLRSGIHSVISDNAFPEIRVYTCMRYWHPMADSVLPQVQAFNPNKLVLVSLYPQMSSTTFWSSLTVWQAVAKKLGYHNPPSVICCYPTEPGFIAASAELIRAEIDKCQAATGRLPRVLFSAHSLPLKVIKDGDPYEWQCQQTAAAITAALDMPGLDTVASFQSKVGPQKWLGPQTEDEIKRAGADKVPLIVYPHAFVSEHVETIVELGIEYREVAEHAGVPYYGVVKTVGTHPDFINGLAGQITSRLGLPGLYSDRPDGCAICPKQFTWCCQRRSQKERLFDGVLPDTAVYKPLQPED